MHRTLWLAWLLFTASLTSAGAWTSPVPDVVVYCEPGLADAMHALAASYFSARHIKVHVFVSPPAGLIGLVSHMARDDVIVANAATLDTLAARRLIQPRPRPTLGVDRYVLVAPLGSPIGRGETLRQIVEHHMLVVTDPTSAASFDGKAVLRRIEPEAMLKYPLIGVADTPGVIYAVLHGADRVGVVHASDVRGMHTLMVIAMPSDARVMPTRIDAALISAGQSRNAGDFLNYLAMPAGVAVLHANGLDELP